MSNDVLKQSAFYKGIDGLRAFCFIVVFFFHCNIEGFQLGWGGVTVFFVISGFLITEILIKSKESKTYFKSFYMRRILRIFPIYFLVLFFATLLVILMKKSLPNDFFYEFTYTQNIFWVFTKYVSDLQPLLAHTWTLAIEEQFYLIWPFLIWIIPKRYLSKVCGFLIILGVVFRIISVIYFNNEFITTILLPSQIDTLSLGALLACYKSELTKSKAIDFLFKNAVIIGVVGIFMVVFLISENNGVKLFSAYSLFRTSSGYIHNIFTAQIFLFLAIFAVGLIYKSIFGKRNLFTRILENKFLTHLGKITYGLYLYHWPIIIILRRFIHDKYILTLVAAIATYFIAISSFYTVEKFFNSMKRRFSYK